MADNRFQTCDGFAGGNFKEAVCIDTGRIYDSCSDKDCLEDLRVYFTECNQRIVDQAVSVRSRRADVITVYIDIEPVPVSYTHLIGVLFLGLAFSNGQESVNGIVIPVWLMLLCSIIMAAGTSVGGEKIIKSVGMDMVKLEKYQGFSADLAAAVCLLFSSLFGIPVSTTHTKTSAIMGVGAVKRLSAINLGVVKEMVLTWIFTFPGCGLISFAMAKLFIAIF